MLVPNQSYDSSQLSELFRRAFIGCQLAPGETVGVLTNAQSPTGYAEACQTAAAVLGAESFVVTVGTPTRPHAEVRGVGEIYGRTAVSATPPVIEALKRCDFVIDLVVLLHSAEQEEILKGGARMLLITEPPEILERLFPTEDLRRRVAHSVDLLRSASRLAITSAAGTDMLFELGEFEPGGAWGFTDGPGTYAHWPSGMVATFGNEGAAHGTWVIDRGDIIFPFKTYVRDPIHIHVEDGFIQSIEGAGVDAELYRDYLESWDDPEGFAMSHVGWGLNERALWNSLGMLDRSATQGMDGRAFAGNVLLSTGPNNEAGGSRFTLAHSDVPLRNCNVWLDGMEILREGSFVPSELQLPANPQRLASSASTRKVVAK